MHIHILLIHSSDDGHLCCFHLLAIMNNANLNTGVRIPQDLTINYFEYISRNGIAIPYGISMFNILRNCHNFSTGATSSYFLPTVKKFPNFSTCSPTFVMFCIFFLTVAILIGVRWLLH